MKKQYVITFRNTNSRLSQTLRYLTSVGRGGYPNLSTEVKDAKIFSTKSEARDEISKIGRNNRYNKDVNIVLA